MTKFEHRLDKRFTNILKTFKSRRVIGEDKIGPSEWGLGYWITPDGLALPVPSGDTHADVAVEYLIGPGNEFESINDIDKLGQDEQDLFYSDINAFAIKNGWTRLRIYPGDPKIGREPKAWADVGSENHIDGIKNLIKKIGVPMETIKVAKSNDIGYVNIEI